MALNPTCCVAFTHQFPSHVPISQMGLRLSDPCSYPNSTGPGQALRIEFGSLSCSPNTKHNWSFLLGPSLGSLNGVYSGRVKDRSLCVLPLLLVWLRLFPYGSYGLKLGLPTTWLFLDSQDIYLVTEVVIKGGIITASKAETELTFWDLSPKLGGIIFCHSLLVASIWWAITDPKTRNPPLFLDVVQTQVMFQLSLDSGICLAIPQFLLLASCLCLATSCQFTPAAIPGFPISLHILLDPVQITLDTD